jgi:hypothetical protein
LFVGKYEGKINFPRPISKILEGTDHLMPRLRMCGAISALLNMSSWHVA